jgi:hypothetical protein
MKQWEENNDINIDDIVHNTDITADQISEFKGNIRFYQKMINRKKLWRMSCYVSKRITEELGGIINVN